MFDSSHTDTHTHHSYACVHMEIHAYVIIISYLWSIARQAFSLILVSSILVLQMHLLIFNVHTYGSSAPCLPGACVTAEAEGIQLLSYVP